MELLNDVYDKIKKVIIECGDLILNINREELTIYNKEGINNIVTNYDILIQNKLKKKLLEIIPNASFIGEEETFNNDINNEYIFVVDPIDGTTNFSRNMNLSAISVALLKNNKPLYGFCYNPYTNELYEARKNSGAYLNGKRIHVSNKTLKEGIVLCGCSPYYDELRKKSLEIQNKLAMVASDYRRLGSAVIELCSIASGKAELYFELKLMPWDYAAASLILEEAGGIIKTIENKDIEYLKPTSIVASNNKEDYYKYLK